jgi:endonuclease/exonuclease/phosphatase family metal-dependent hydrolase
LLGTASNLTAFVTQRIEFNARDAFMRPGALLSVRHDGHDYTLLFFHLASMNDPRGFGLRQDMIDRAFTFKREVVDVLSPAEPNFIFLGDLNTMGLEYDFAQPGGPGTPIDRDRASAEHEIARLSYEGGKVGMRVLTKTRDATWRSLSDESNLDHVVAADHLQFRQFSGRDVAVRGWPELGSEKEQRDWIEGFSDHELLFFVVQEI